MTAAGAKRWMEHIVNPPVGKNLIVIAEKVER